MAKYRKKSVVIEAMKWIGSNFVEIDNFITVNHETYPSDGVIKIPTLEGVMEASLGDYIIKGVKGEFYPCKPDIFQSTYDAVSPSGMSFGSALEVMKAGSKVARAGWNGKGMWVALSGTGDGPNGGRITKAADFWNPHSRKFAEENGGEAEVLPTIIMKTADGCILMGWLASQSDMQANDWGIVE